MNLIPLLYAIFFFSGAVGLNYEILWLRVLEKITGSSAVAVSILLATFMAGLGSGSLLGGKRAKAILPKERLIFMYGLLEGAIGIWALFIPVFTTFWEPFLSMLYNVGPKEGQIYYMGCLLVGLFLIFPPTFLMGMTLPFLVQYVEWAASLVGIRSGILYGLNTLGGAGGAIYAGFVGIPKLGTNLTLLSGVLTSLIISGVSYFAFRLQSSRSDPLSPKVNVFSEEMGQLSKDRLIILSVLFSVSGASSISFEIVLTNLLSLLIGPTTYTFSIVVSTYIIGIGLGSLLFSKLFKTSSNMRLIVVIQLAMAVSFLLLSHFLGNCQLFFSKLIFTLKDNLILLWVTKGFLLFVVLIFPTLLSGGLFPVILKVLSPDYKNSAQSAGTLYAANTLGCIVGSIVTGFILLPLMGKVYAIKAIVAFQVILTVTCTIFWHRYVERVSSWFRACYVPAGVIIVMVLFLPRWDVGLLSYGRYHNFSGLTPLFHRLGWIRSIFEGTKALRLYEKAREIIFAGDGLNGFTVVERYKDSAGTEKLSLITSGKPDASSHGDRATQCLLAHVPMMFHKGAKEVMVLGLASGMTAGEVLNYPIDSLDVVEINPQVMKATALFEAYNNQLLKDKRVRVILQDGRVHLTHTKQRYDVIISEPSNPWMAGLANLFSYEFFKKGRARLKENGIFLQWIHGYEMDWETFSIVCRTFFQVFPSGLLLRTSPEGDDYLLLGMKDGKGPDADNIYKNMAYVRKSKLVSITSPSVIGHLIVMENPHEIFGPGPIHTDTRPILEFKAPKLLYTKRQDVAENLFKYGKKQRLAAFLLKEDEKLSDFALYEFTLSIFQPIFSLLNHLQGEQLEKAKEMTLTYCNTYFVSELEAIEDRYLRSKCAEYQKRLISRHLSDYSDDWLAMIDLGKVLYLLDEKEKAISSIERAIEISKEDPAPFKTLGIIAMKELDWDNAKAYFERSLSLDPYDPFTYFNLGLIKYQQGLLDEAKSFLKKGLSLQEDIRARLLLNELEGKVR